MGTRKKKLLEKYDEEKVNDRDVADVLNSEHSSECKSDTTINKYFIISVILLIIIFILLFICMKNFNKINQYEAIIQSSKQSNDEVNLVEQDIIDQSNQQTIDEYKLKLIGEIGYSEEEFNTLCSEYSDDFSLISVLDTTYQTEYETLNKQISELEDKLKSYQIQIEIKDMTMREQVNSLSSAVSKEEERLAKLEEEKIKEDTNSGSEEYSNSDSQESTEPDSKSSSESSSEDSKSNMCNGDYDSAYNQALDKMLANDYIKGFSIDSNNCPIYKDANGNIVN